MPFVHVINQKSPCLVKSTRLSDTTAEKQLAVDSSQNEENIPYEYYFDADSLEDNNIQNGSSLHVVPNIAAEQGGHMISNQTLRGKIKLA